jgi:DNA-binding transcriptional ArsR family regulator
VWETAYDAMIFKNFKTVKSPPGPSGKKPRSKEFEQEAVRVFKALGDPTRYRIVRLLLERGELGCGDFSGRFGLSLPALSHHYRVLENSKLISVRKAGSHVYIRLNREYLQHFVPGFEEAHFTISSHKGS